jgi:ABC-2 type transport system permease protein
MNAIDEARVETRTAAASLYPLADAASAPTMRKKSSAVVTELFYLLRIQYADVRETWIWVVVLASVFPLTTLLFMRFFLESPSPDTVMRIVSGNLIFPIIIMGINGLGNQIAWSKHQGQFTFYASLPISKVNFLLAFMIRGLLMSLPSVLIMSILAQFVFDVRFHFNIGLLPMVLLSVAGPAGIGALIGFLSPNQELTNMITNLLMVFLNFLTPVMIDIHQLPPVLQAVSYVFPTTYAADGLRQLLQGNWTTAVSLDMLALALFTIVSFWIASRNMDWRLEK